MLFSEACDVLICEVHVHWPSRSKGLHSRPVYESLCKNVFLGERLDLECLSSRRRKNEYQQFVGQPELQKHTVPIHRGYYTVARRYEFYVRVARVSAANE